MENGEELAIKSVNIEEVINTFGDFLYEKTGECKRDYDETVNEHSEYLAHDVKSVMIKYGLSHERVMDYIKDGFFEIIDDAHKTMESQKRKYEEVLNYAKGEMDELRKTKLDPASVQARISKIKYFFDSQNMYIDDSFVEYSVSDFSKKFFNKFDITDFNVEREIKNQFNAFSDEMMKKYVDTMKDMQDELNYEFSKSCEQLEMGINQEQKVTEALDHPEELRDEDIIIFAQGKSQEELEQSYRDAKKRIIEDPSLDEQRRKEQLTALDNMYSKVLENGIPIDYVYDSSEPNLDIPSGPKL